MGSAKPYQKSASHGNRRDGAQRQRGTGLPPARPARVSWKASARYSSAHTAQREARRLRRATTMSADKGGVD